MYEYLVQQVRWRSKYYELRYCDVRSIDLHLIKKQLQEIYLGCLQCLGFHERFYRFSGFSSWLAYACNQHTQRYTDHAVYRHL